MITSEQKLFLYDVSQVKKQGAMLENAVALHLLKACHFWTDTAQGEFSLFFLRDKDKKEVDFLITRDANPWVLIEVKSGEKNPSKSLISFGDKLKIKHKFQLVADKNYDKVNADTGVRVVSIEKFLANLV